MSFSLIFWNYFEFFVEEDGAVVGLVWEWTWRVSAQGKIWWHQCHLGENFGALSGDSSVFYLSEGATEWAEKVPYD